MNLWRGAHKNAFVRDVLRDYCLVFTALHAQAQRFATCRSISYAVLRDILGKDMRKGVFWRLKDTAHHLFRTPQSVHHITNCEAESDTGTHSLWQYSSGKTPGGMVRLGTVEGLLDWCIGYAFHECVKLKEDAFQRQHYAHRLHHMQEKMSDMSPICTQALYNLTPLLEQTQESIARELQRICTVLAHIRPLLINYLQGYEDTGAIARFLFIRNALVREVFAEHYPALLTALYGAQPRRLYLMAAQGWIDGGRPEEAQFALEHLLLPMPEHMPEYIASDDTLLREATALHERIANFSQLTFVP